MTQKEMEHICLKQAETNLEMVCYLHSSFESGMYHHCDKCVLKRKRGTPAVYCVLYALKNAIADQESEQ